MHLFCISTEGWTGTAEVGVSWLSCQRDQNVPLPPSQRCSIFVNSPIYAIPFLFPYENNFLSLKWSHRSRDSERDRSPLHHHRKMAAPIRGGGRGRDAAEVQIRSSSQDVSRARCCHGRSGFTPSLHTSEGCGCSCGR